MGRLSNINIFAKLTTTAVAESKTINFTNDTGATIAEVIIPVQNDVHIFVDNSGNVNQIKKISKERLKYYIDEELPEKVYCVIGVDDPDSGPCSYGTALGIGDNMMAFAIYSAI
jgi:hypothetical protein